MLNLTRKVIRISIDWIKAESKPDKKQRVKGKKLMDLRLTIKNLENQLNRKIQTMENLSEELNKANRDVAKKNRLILAIKNKVNNEGRLTKDEFSLLEKQFEK